MLPTELVSKEKRSSDKDKVVSREKAPEGASDPTAIQKEKEARKRELLEVKKQLDVSD